MAPRPVTTGAGAAELSWLRPRHPITCPAASAALFRRGGSCAPAGSAARAPARRGGHLVGRTLPRTPSAGACPTLPDARGDFPDISASYDGLITSADGWTLPLCGAGQESMQTCGGLRSDSILAHGGRCRNWCGGSSWLRSWSPVWRRRPRLHGSSAVRGSVRPSSGSGSTRSSGSPPRSRPGSCRRRWQPKASAAAGVRPAGGCWPARATTGRPSARCSGLARKFERGDLARTDSGSWG